MTGTISPPPWSSPERAPHETHMSQPLPPGASPDAAGVSFPCKSCGAKLAFDPASQGMACPYCGAKETVTAGAPGAATGMIREIPLEQGMALAQKGYGAPVTTIKCGECGATVNVGEGERTAACAFCGSKQVLSQETNQGAIRPESLVPFKVTKQDANARFGTWIGKLWSPPKDHKKMAQVQEIGGVYIPFWTFDASVRSQWSADRGWDSAETETYTETVDGRSETRTRQVQR